MLQCITGVHVVWQCITAYYSV